jgi:hypothetical protein
LGKDVIAIAPGGKLFAYQLKGNPGGRLTISQWQDLIPQINTLVYQPVSHPAVRRGALHVPVLVTNGEIHEDVYAAIAAYNTAVQASVPRAEPLETISRGALLKMLIDSADTLWPAGVQAQRNILNVFSAAGDDELPTEEFIQILTAVLNDKYAETAIPAVHLVTAIVASSWIAKENYFELVKMYVLLAVASVCYQARWKKQRAKDKRFIDEIVFDIRSHLGSFVEDISKNYKREPFLNKNIFAEFAYYHPRRKILAGLASAVILDRDMTLTEQQSEFLRALISNKKQSRFMLWEGIVPYCLAEFWALSNVQGTQDPDYRLIALISGILNSNDQENAELHLPGPYYSLREVVERNYKVLLQNFRSEIDQDSHYRRSWYADALFMLLVRRNYKRTCKVLWPSLTRFTHTRTPLPDAISFGPASCKTAISEDKLIDVTTQKTWDQVTSEASEEVTPLIPSQLLMRPVLVLLYCLFVPQRMDRDLILWLDRQFCKSTW